MTMRLDIVTNDAGELVRREHARELGAGVVVALYRLVKLAQMHDLGNQAFLRQLEQTHQMIGEYCLRSGSNVSVLFADKATFVAGQLLKGNRGAYEAAAELGALLERIGGSELHISRDITREDLNAFAEQVSVFHRTGSASQLRIPPKMHLRRVADTARLRGIELEQLTPDQRIVRAYASAVVIMRRFFEDLSASRYVLPRRIKRIAQSLVDLSDASTASYLGVTEVRNANHDEAGRSVNTAILAVAIARETTHDRTTLAQIALSALMHDVARPRALAIAGAGGSPIPGMAGPTALSEDQEDRLPAGAAAVLTALGRVNEPTITRTVLTFEALWLRRKTWLGPVYWGARPPTLQATIIAIARRYNDLLTPEPGLAPPTTDYAVAVLANELTDPLDRTVLRMLVSALGLLPSGTVAQLSTGEVAEVTRGTKGLGDKARVKIVADPNGVQYAMPVEVDLARDPHRTIVRVLSVDGWQRGLEGGPSVAGIGPESDHGIIAQVASAAPPPAAFSRNVSTSEAPKPKQQQERSDSGSFVEQSTSSSMSSLGSSPSSVAEAMGRMINDSLRPSAIPPREADRPDHTVFQPQGPDDAPAPRITSSPAREATARGNLALTPLPHVLVYMLDHALTGSVVFEETKAGGRGPDDTIFFVNGVPTKVRLRASVSLLGEVLVEHRALEPRSLDQAVEGARRLGILLGEYLVGHDLVSREALVWSLERQLLKRIAHVANLAPEVQYAYYRDIDLLAGSGGDVAVSHPLNPILASVRHWTDRARVRATLNRIGKHPLILHGDSDLSNMAVLAEEQRVLDAMRAETITLPQLFKRNLAEDEIVSSLVYSLAVTRQFAFKGQKKGPMAARGAAWRSVQASPASGLSSSSSMPPVEASGRFSSSPPVVPISESAAMPAGTVPLAPDNPHVSNASSSNKVVVPSARAAPSASSSTMTRAGAVRSAKAPGGRPAVPQIRPIAARKPTMIGIHAGAPPPLRDDASRSNLLAARLTPDGVADDESDADDAKTIARMSPVTKAVDTRTAVREPQASHPKPMSPAIAFTTARDASPGIPPPSHSTVKSSSRGPIGDPRGIVSPRNRAISTKNVSTVDDDDISDDATGKRVPVDLEAASSIAALADDGLAHTEAALEAMTSFRLAEGALARNDMANAEEHAKRAVAGDPTQADYLALLVWVRALTGGRQPTEDAIRTLSKVLIEDPSNERALFYRGKLLVRTNRLHEALNDFNELLSANPHHQEAQVEVRELKGKVP